MADAARLGPCRVLLDRAPVRAHGALSQYPISACPPRTPSVGLLRTRRRLLAGAGVVIVSSGAYGIASSTSTRGEHPHRPRRTGSSRTLARARALPTSAGTTGFPVGGPAQAFALAQAAVFKPMTRSCTSSTPSSPVRLYAVSSPRAPERRSGASPDRLPYGRLLRGKARLRRGGVVHEETGVARRSSERSFGGGGVLGLDHPRVRIVAPNHSAGNNSAPGCCPVRNTRLRVDSVSAGLARGRPCDAGPEVEPLVPGRRRVPGRPPREPARAIACTCPPQSGTHQTRSLNSRRRTPQLRRHRGVVRVGDERSRGPAGRRPGGSCRSSRGAHRADTSSTASPSPQLSI